MTKESTLIPFTNDHIFSLVMRNEEICREFLEMIIPGEEFGEIVIAESEQSSAPELIIDTSIFRLLWTRRAGILFQKLLSKKGLVFG